VAWKNAMVCEEEETSIPSKSLPKTDYVLEEGATNEYVDEDRTTLSSPLAATLVKSGAAEPNFVTLPANSPLPSPPPRLGSTYLALLEHVSPLTVPTESPALSKQTRCRGPVASGGSEVPPRHSSGLASPFLALLISNMLPSIPCPYAEEHTSLSTEPASAAANSDLAPTGSGAVTATANTRSAHDIQSKGSNKDNSRYTPSFNDGELSKSQTMSSSSSIASTASSSSSSSSSSTAKTINNVGLNIGLGSDVPEQAQDVPTTAQVCAYVCLEQVTTEEYEHED
jgi:hypothetical protein